ncbi:hypothetical protein Mal64_38360 [Pseudobythopirellula maris]|uniref:PEP-CTERM protein-sorting domain-containing protein n=1 Tax=Pseudobythopirellula maris TaxID=2527991 RepID=A0A5C5ZGF2_9BACT|nr:hypothetical protein [Pseudobythopirellula maris]TWT86296.1 hypothetical protein Mal64_38360 [Pseudobythopirellula maris]
MHALRTPRTFALASIAATLLACASSAHAAPIGAGGVAFPVGTTSAANPDFAGPVQDDPLRGFEIRDNFDNLLLTGNLQDRVSLSDNVGTLIFAPRLRDLVSVPGGPAVRITRLQVDGYGDHAIDVEYRTDGSGDVGPGTVVRSFDSNSLRFHYDLDPILPPDESYFPSVFTDATDFAPIGVATITAEVIGGGTYTATIHGVNVPVPEPTGCLLLTAGLTAAATCRRRAPRRNA